MIELVALVLALLAFYGMSGEPRPALDVVVLAEDTVGMRPALMRTVAPALRPGDRVAVMTFRRHARLVEEFTSDADAVRWALVSVPRGEGEVRVSGAVADAARLLAGLPADPKRRRAVLLIFGSEDALPRPDEAREALAAARASLYVSAVPRAYPLQTPPMQYRTHPLPAATLQALHPFAAAVTENTWDLPALLRQIR